ncbi:MAG TPA: thioredoxin domain-containing protein [Nitrospirota bacterium]|nr:thioredoxin domain-containing protein [Nitrospirota bacterium]
MSDTVLLRCSACKTLNRIPVSRLEGRPLCGQCRTPLVIPRAPLHASTASFDQQVAGWPGFLLAEFWAKWCGYCRSVEPFIADLASKRAGRLKIIKIDVDAEPVLARRFQIKATPTFIVYNNGRFIARLDGAPARQEDLVHWLDNLMK